MKRPHGYKLLEQVDQPLSLQHHSTTVLYNHAEIMIKIQHSCHFFLVNDVANLSNQREKLIEIHEVYLLGHKSINSPFKIEPPRKRETKIMLSNAQSAIFIKAAWSGNIAALRVAANLGLASR